MQGTEASQRGEFFLLGDQPALDGEDPLGFDEVAEKLATLILDSHESTPFTLGIEGAWGMGKSTLMGRLRARLKKEPNVEAILFNAWTADESGVLEGLMKAVLNKMDPNVLRRSLRDEKLLRGLRLVVSLVAGFLGFGNIVDTFWEKVSTDPRARNDLRDLVEKAIEQWRGQHTGVAGDRILCVLVDDLDRCSPKGVIEVFEAMKLYLNVKGIVFIVGYDQGIVSDLVLKEKGYSLESIQSRDYIEKFIQIDFQVPRAVADRSNDLVDSMLRASGTRELFGEAEREIVIAGSGSNPRKIKRFINAFVLGYGLEPMWRDFKPEDLIRLFLLRMQFREFLGLLEARTDDPVPEFFEYRELQSSLRRQDETERESIGTAMKRFGLVAGMTESFEAVLARLNDNVDDEFVRFADRRDLVGLLENLVQSDDWERLRKAISEGELSIPDEDESSEAASSTGEQRAAVLDDLRVLWVDDSMELNEGLISQILEAGAAVIRLTDGEELRAWLADGGADVLISDINRPDDPEAGFNSLEELAAEGVRLPPTVIFFAMQVTAHRKRRAAAFSAPVINDPGALFQLLVEAAEAKVAAPELGSSPAAGSSSDF